MWLRRSICICCGREIRSNFETETLIATTPPVVMRPHPTAVQGYRRLAETLRLAIDGDAGEGLRHELRKLIEAVEFVPVAGLGSLICASAANASARCVGIPRPGSTKTPPFQAGFLMGLTSVRYRWVQEPASIRTLHLP